MIQTFRARKKKRERESGKASGCFRPRPRHPPFGIRQARAKVGEKGWRKFEGEERDSRVSTRATALQINPLCKGDDEAYGGARTRQSGRGTASSPVHKSDSPRCMENGVSIGGETLPANFSKARPVPQFYTVDQIVRKKKCFLVLLAETSSSIRYIDPTIRIRIIDLTFVEQYICRNCKIEC